MITTTRAAPIRPTATVEDRHTGTATIALRLPIAIGPGGARYRIETPDRIVERWEGEFWVDAAESEARDVLAMVAGRPSPYTAGRPNVYRLLSVPFSADDGIVDIDDDGTVDLWDPSEAPAHAHTIIDGLPCTPAILSAEELIAVVTALETL